LEGMKLINYFIYRFLSIVYILGWLVGARWRSFFKLHYNIEFLIGLLFLSARGDREPDRRKKDFLFIFLFILCLSRGIILCL